MKILVTGGSGFIGSYFYGPLGRAGHSVVNYDLQPPPSYSPQSPFIRADVRDAMTLRRAMEGCDAVLHLAAAHHDFGIAHDTYFDVNERAAQLICDAMDEHRIRNACFYSTVAIYGDATPPLDEEHPNPQPNSPYGASKLAGEKVFKRWTDKGDDRRCLVIRPTVTFGPRNFANMYSLIRQIHSGKFFPVGAGKNIKSLSYVENIVAATEHLWLNTGSQRAAFDVFNYVDKPDMTSGQITAAVYEDLNRKLPGWSIPYPVARVLALPFDAVIAMTGKNLPVSSARIKKLTTTETKFEADKVVRAGFTPPVSLREGIRRMVSWYLAEGKDQSAEWHQPPATPVIAPEPASV